jgi:hypothetical protein
LARVFTAPNFTIPVDNWQNISFAKLDDVSATNSVNIGAVTHQNRAKARSIGSSKYENLKLKKKERREEESRRLLNIGSDNVPRQGHVVRTLAVTVNSTTLSKGLYLQRNIL